jgi:hypothetical protein
MFKYENGAADLPQLNDKVVVCSVKSELAGKTGTIGGCVGTWIGESPYVGSPNDVGCTVECHTYKHNGEKPAARFNVGGWPGYHTHWTKIKIPGDPV